jgi:hypothetical protein
MGASFRNVPSFAEPDSSYRRSFLATMDELAAEGARPPRPGRVAAPTPTTATTRPSS